MTLQTFEFLLRKGVKIYIDYIGVNLSLENLGWLSNQELINNFVII